MSFISVIARENFITVMSDGRVMNYEDVPIEENFQKFINIENRSFIAFGGTRELCEMITKDIVPILKNELNYSIWLQSFRRVLESLKLNQNNLKCMFAFGGINHERNIEFYTINSITLDSKKFNPYGDQISYAFVNNTKNADKLYEDKSIELFRETGFSTPSEVIQAQRLLNNFVSTQDVSVNNVTFRMIIKK
jgi:hypothetical protein